jgi:hypothetical protein
VSHRRTSERGLFRGCCLGLVLLLALVGFSAYLIDRAIAAPELGADAAGPAHGSSEQQIAVALGAQLAAELLANTHAVVTLSEADLSVIAAQNNPHPDRFHAVAARVRGGSIAVSALTNEGPLTVTGVAYVGVALDRSQGTPQLAVQVVRLDVGELTLPGWLRDRLLGSVSPSLAIDQLLDSGPALRALRDNLECVVVARDGLRIGVHRPGIASDPATCGG